MFQSLLVQYSGERSGRAFGHSNSGYGIGERHFAAQEFLEHSASLIKRPAESGFVMLAAFRYALVNVAYAFIDGSVFIGSQS